MRDFNVNYCHSCIFSTANSQNSECVVGELIFSLTVENNIDSIEKDSKSFIGDLLNTEG